MMNLHDATPCGGYPQGAGSGTNVLPSAKPDECYLVPDPNLETLKTILRLHGCDEFYVNAIAHGYVPREYRFGATRFWKVRDAFYQLAAHSVRYFTRNVPWYCTLDHVLPMIAETLNPEDPLIHEMNNAVNAVNWTQCFCPAGSFWWPTYIPYSVLPDNLHTALRLSVLHCIWCMSPALLSVDFSSGLVFFDDVNLANIQSMIASAFYSQTPAMENPIQQPSDQQPSDQQSPVQAESGLDANVKRIIDVLQDRAMTRGQLEAALNVKRNTLRKHFILPAEKMGLIGRTERGSSRNLKYKLTAKGATMGEKQDQKNPETGLPDPVSTDLKSIEKQVETLENSFPALCILRARKDAPAIRLARYRRWRDAERALITYFRVERFYRSASVSEKWKQIGIVEKLDKNLAFRFLNCIIDPMFWGLGGGVIHAILKSNGQGGFDSFVIRETNLLKLFAQRGGLDLATCSQTERAEMAKFNGIISPVELYLMNYAVQRFGISCDLNKPYHGDHEALQPVAIEPFITNQQLGPTIIFRGKKGSPQQLLGRMDVGGRTILLPLRYYASAKAPTLNCVMPEVSDNPILYNSDLIAANPEAEVILTDEIGIPLVNDSDEDYIFSTVYGGTEVIEGLDHDLLNGHPLKWLCIDNGDGPVKMYEKAVKVGRTIFQQHGRKIAFQVFDRVMWTANEFGMDAGMYENTRMLSFDELMTEASKYGVGGTANATNDLRVLKLNELLKLKPEDYILYPVMKAGFYCLIYGGSGVAKTWFALHLAICLSQGIAPFEHWEYRAVAPLNVLYIAGEMRETEYGSRLRKLLADQDANPHFGLIRENLDLTTEADQERIIKAVKDQKSQVVVLDNLSTLATNGHLDGQFEKVLALIHRLQADGIIVMLVHHENREGGFKGSGKIELVADQSLHLFSAGDGNTIKLLVRAEKIRMTSRAEQTAFRTEFDPESPAIIWPMVALEEEDRRRLDIDDPLGEVERNIGKKRKNNQLAWEYLNDDERATAILDDMLNGCLDDVIAADLAVRESVIADFKRQNHISRETLDQFLPDAKKTVEKTEKKSTPEKLAPVIWNLLKYKGNKNR